MLAGIGIYLAQVMNVLLEWIKEYWQDFALDAALVAKLNVWRSFAVLA